MQNQRSLNMLCLLLPSKRRPLSAIPPRANRNSTAPTSIQNAGHHQSFSPTTQRLHLLRHHPSLDLYLSVLPISHSQNFSPSLTLSSSLPQPCWHLDLYHRVLLGSTPIEFLFLLLVANLSLWWVCREIQVWFSEYLLIHGCILIEIREAPTPRGRTTPLEGVAAFLVVIQ